MMQVVSKLLSTGLVLTRLKYSYLSGYKAWQFCIVLQDTRRCSCLHHIFSPLNRRYAAITIGRGSVFTLDFYWDVVALRCCVSFCHGKGISLHGHICSLLCWIPSPCLGYHRAESWAPGLCRHLFTAYLCRVPVAGMFPPQSPILPVPRPPWVSVAEFSCSGTRVF